jgi:hypothetical protein
MAFNKGLVNSEVLVQTIKSRQLTVHTYNEAAADAIFHDVINKYYEAFNELRESLQKQYELRKL